MMDWNWDHGWGYMHGFGWLFMVLFWVLVILGIVSAARWIISSPRQSSPPPSKTKTALDILDERFARGEIEQEEYEQKRQVLKK